MIQLLDGVSSSTVMLERCASLPTGKAGWWPEAHTAASGYQQPMKCALIDPLQVIPTGTKFIVQEPRPILSNSSYHVMLVARRESTRKYGQIHRQSL